jgi:hypothetical protein
VVAAQRDTRASSRAPRRARRSSSEPCCSREFQPMPAQIIGAALEQRDLHRQPQRLRQQRHVAAIELILQVRVPVEMITLRPDSSAGTR